ncbi:MAG: cytochrome o ubiquinol oxidase subunit III [Patescibacteria group bacterium]
MTRAEEQVEIQEKRMLGFWIYLMTDIVLFATLFATFIVLRNATAGGPSGAEIFDMPYVLVETFILLASSFTIGMALIDVQRGFKKHAIIWLLFTFVLGIAFLVLEISEFAVLVSEGHGPQQSAFLSAFFTLVATHGLHIAIGLLWMIVVIVRLIHFNFRKTDINRLALLALFWHFLDIIWIFVFTIVYLIGGMA